MKKQKEIKVRLVERLRAGKATEPYRLLEELIAGHHERLAECRITLVWQKGWKPSVDGSLILAKVVPASKLDKLLVDVDYGLNLNEESWPGLNELRKTIVLDRELYRIQPDVDRDGEQKRDTKDRLCWRLRPYLIREFPEIIERYGIDEILHLQVEAKDAADIGSRPLFAGLDVAIVDDQEEAQPEAETPPDSDGKEVVKPDAWRRMSVKNLSIKPKLHEVLENNGFPRLGKLIDWMQEKGAWWNKDVAGIGDLSKVEVGNAVADFQRDHPEFDFR